MNKREREALSLLFPLFLYCSVVFCVQPLYHLPGSDYFKVGKRDYWSSGNQMFCMNLIPCRE